MPAPEIIHQLVQQFSDNRDAYRSGRYNEAQLRQEFLNPFFEALGWDVSNRKGYSINYREVVHEDSIHIKGSPHAKAPDYAFRLGGVRKFFVEAKKPAEDIQFDRELAYQLKVYAWNVGLPISILTDFEEFAVYDCRNKPNPSDSPAAARIMYIRFDQYIEKWDELFDIFSPTAIQKGAFDRYVADTSSKKGTTHVDDAFLADIEEWRTLLARNIALRNQHVVNERQLNYAVQMTIDRIIFLRICEDRGIEPSNQLLDLSKSKDIYPQLVQLFQRADLKYNSGLFHFKAEKGESNHADKLTPHLVIDDKVLKEIIKSLYYPCPYIFKEIPVEILGQVYEQFLGKVIRLTPGHKAVIEEKPEVRKAGGVYYTPSYIVDYIVANTVGKLVEGKSPEQVSQLKIVDPACGSGSFLLGAFQYLLDWHERWYLANQPEKWAKGKQPALIPTEGGDWKLTTAEKKRILVNNMYGVDIDAQAVEVTKLSLLLKVLEEESGQLSLGLERVLPDLGDNIKCGNSLIGWDYFEGQLMPDEKELERVNPFDWQRNFPQVFGRGGFDAVIGNPPYGATLTASEKKYLQKFNIGTTDTAALMMANSYFLTSYKGKNGFIVPKPFLYSSTWTKTRNLLLKDLQIICDVNRAWKQVLLEQVIYVVQKGIGSNNYSTYRTKDNFFEQINEIEKNDCGTFGFIINNLSNETILLGKKSWKNSASLNDLIDNTRGGMFQRDVSTEVEDFKVIGGKQLARYKIEGQKGYCKKKITEQFPNANIKQNSLLFQNIIAHIANPIPHIKIIGTISDESLIQKYVILDTVNQFTNISNYSSYFLLGLLHSKFVNWFTYLFVFANAIRTMHFDGPTTVKIPIPLLNLANKSLALKHDRMVAMVERMLELHKRDPQTPQEADRLQREIAATDAAIDKLVYELYGLTDEEVRIVEGGN
jgi:hypothetical protein